MDVSLFQQIVESMPYAVTLQDAEGRFLYVSPSIQSLLGHTPEELVGTLAQDLIHPEDLKHVKCTVNGRPLEDGAHRKEFRCRTKEGAYRRIRARTELFHDENNRAFLLRFLADIPMPRTPEEEILKMRALEAVARLAGGIAHEFNNVNTIVTGYACLLLQSHPEGDDDFEALSHIRRGAERIARLTRQILALAGQAMFVLEFVDLNEVVQSLKPSIKRTLGPDIQLRLELAPSLPQTEVDEEALRRVVLDLCGNAREAMPQGGRLTLTTTALAASEPLPPGMRRGCAVRLTITDTGCGMSERALGHLYEPFFTTKEVGEGLGLNLAAAYGTIRQLGGHLGVVSWPEQGTTFTITLPANSNL